MLERNELAEILANPADHIESQKYFSWEQFFTFLLTDRTKGTYLKYSKKKLNISYLNKKVKEKILKTIEGIKF